MPAFVKHEDSWEKARQQADKQGLSPKDDSYWKYTTSIYRKMHPEDFAKNAVEQTKNMLFPSSGGSLGFNLSPESKDVKAFKAYSGGSLPTDPGKVKSYSMGQAAESKKTTYPYM